MSVHASIVDPERAVGGNVSADDSALNDSGTRRALPFDVMAHIMARSTPSIISALMKTCHLYYHEGPRYLLRDGVVLRSPMRVERFLPFISAEGGARFVHFRELDIAVDMYRVPRVDVERCMERLAQLLDFPEICLESLTLQDADCLLEYAGIASARGTRNTERLIYRRGGPTACSALKSLNCSLVSLTISFNGYDKIEWADVEELQAMGGWSYLLDALSPHVQTLETFRCDYDIPKARNPRPLSTSSSSRQAIPHNQCFSTVRTLGLTVRDLCPQGQIDVASFFPTFPNVTHLEIFSEIPAHTLAPLGQSLKERDKAIFEQDGCWAALEKCSGRLPSLYAIGLVCHVVDLCIWSGINNNDDLSMLATIVSTTRPKVLRLCVEYIPFTFLAQVTEALRDSAFKSLNTLHIVINYLFSPEVDDDSVDLSESIFAESGPYELSVEHESIFVGLTQLPSHIADSPLQAYVAKCVLHTDGYQLEPQSDSQGVDSSYRYYDENYDSSDESWAFSD
ncbi:hypothetical protein L227DRAFT_613171 [Lentinus tigrinus ALCF2SS1-6]|uniref:F-box domain-containing protein n=2 Tax=Lentinus tigrinus TaxID=5365 RepID=A0A5C2S556_9APHY|nr:hypothetical protein L227DRAFT_613171 [Lentinus tigrinus ALCF2SS1-6]